MSEDNKRVVLQFMEAMSTGNAALGAPCITEDACAIAKGYGKFAGRREADVMIGMIEAFNTLVPGGLKFEIKSVIAGDDSIAVEAEGNAVTSEGVPYRNQYCFVFHLRGGKIAQVNEYFCNVHADEVLWPLVEADAGGNLVLSHPVTPGLTPGSRCLRTAAKKRDPGSSPG